MKKIINNILCDGIKCSFIDDTKKYHILYNETLDTSIKRSEVHSIKIACNDCGEMTEIKKLQPYHLYKKFYCKKCRSKGERNGMFGKHLSYWARKKISEKTKGANNHMYGKKHSDETKKKISNKNKGKLNGNKNPMYGINVYEYVKKKNGIDSYLQMKKNLSDAMKGENNPFYGKHHTEETKKIISEKTKYTMSILAKNDEYKKRVANGMLNSDKLKQSRASKEYKDRLSYALKHSEIRKKVMQSDEYRKKRSDCVINRIKELRKLGGFSKRGFIPNFNPKACEYFDRLMAETNTNIQHALNGGEFIVPDLNYFVDGYDAINNIVYEYDEKHHYKNGILKEEDIIRQNKIIEKLNCKFIRIKEDEIN